MLAYVIMLQKEKYQLAKEQEIITKQFEQQRIKAAEVGKLTRAYEALEKHQQQRLSEIKKTDLAIIQTVRENSARETVELRKRLVVMNIVFNQLWSCLTLFLNIYPHQPISK